MADENLQIVRAGHEAFSRGDLTEMLQALDPDVVSYTASPLPEPGEHHGLEGVLTWIGNWTAEFGEFEMHAEDFIDVGDHIIARVHQRATGAESGAPVERDFWFLHALRNGKIVRIGVHDTEADALEAAGLSSSKD